MNNNVVIIPNQKHLKHYGVKGMRWRVRRSKTTTTTQRRMSNAELNNRLKRLRMEAELDRYMRDRSPDTNYMMKVGNTTKNVAELTSNALKIYNNINQFIDIGKSIKGRRS